MEGGGEGGQGEDTWKVEYERWWGKRQRRGYKEGGTWKVAGKEAKGREQEV